MPTYYRYPEDLTGVNPDNLVVGEVITLNDRPIRVAVPKYAPFFTKSLVVIDELTQRVLTKGIDYSVPIISQEASLRTGEEIGDAFLIENKDVSPNIRVTYQVLGGSYQSNIANITQIYEAYINDNRSVDWLTGVYGKPDTYPPSLHPHWLSEIYGFEPITVQLERIAQAIMLGNTPAFEMFLESIETRFATLTDMEMGKPLKRAVTLEGLLHVLNKYNFNSIVMTPESFVLKNGRSLWFDVNATNVPDEKRYYWTIEHETSTMDDFVAQSGIVNLVNGKGRFMIQSFRDTMLEPEEYFRVYLRRNGPDGQIVVKSRRLKLLKHLAYVRILDVLRVCSVNDPRVPRIAKSVSIKRSFANASHS